MALSCGPKIVRYLFFAFNLLIWILGIVVLAVGIWSHAQGGTWKQIIDMGSMAQAANLLIAAGVIVAILGFLGCCGAIKKVRPLLIAYALLVFLIFVLEIAAGAYAYNKRAAVEKKIASGVKKAIDENYGKPALASVAITKLVDKFQQKIKCCGINGPNDYHDSYWFRHNNTAHAQVPMSCCRKQTKGCNLKVNLNSTVLYNKGCMEQGKAYAEKNVMLLVNVGVAIAIVELLGIVFAVCLWFAFRKEECGERIG